MGLDNIPKEGWTLELAQYGLYERKEKQFIVKILLKKLYREEYL